LKYADVVGRFQDNTRLRFKPGSKSRSQYLGTLKRFWRQADLDKVSKRQLAGRMGREAVLAFMETMPLRSRRTVLAHLKAIFAEGFELPFPVDVRRDFGRTLPPIGTRETPPDDDVRPWADAVRNEKDPYVRLLVLLLLQYGWRPENQVGKMRWGGVRYDDAGRPRAFIAKGAQLGFKTHSDIVAWIPPDVADALERWKRECPDVSPEAPILPRKGVRGKIDTSRLLDKQAVARLLASFERKWGLKHISPAYFRHWVKTTCRRLSDPALAALQGHRPPKDGSMRNVYDTPGIERILAEQEAEFPHGPLGIFRKPEIIVEPDLTSEIQVLREWKEGRIGLVELISRLEGLKQRSENLDLRA